MNGWLNYYGIAGIKTFIQRVDEWLRARIRQYLWKSWKQPKTRYKNLVKLGMPESKAYPFSNTRKGHWRMAHSKALAMTLTNKKLEKCGLMNLSRKLWLIQNA